MGFIPQRTQHRLTFRDIPELDGLEVTMAAMTVREFNKLVEMAVPEDGKDGVTSKTVAANDYVLDLFARNLDAWNLEDEDGEPVPTTRAGIDSQEQGIINQLITAWQVAMASVPPPLPKRSRNGRRPKATEESLGLDEMSVSLPH